jgi:epoxyqueuosine reductase
MTASTTNLADAVKREAKSLGFDLVGIAPAQASLYADYFKNWLASARHGEMDYLARRTEERLDPAKYLPGARSVICVALSYFVPASGAPEDQVPSRIARYALGDDYHDVLKSRLHTLADWLRQTLPNCQTKVGVDTAPIAEKELSARAGIGWIGKNTCIINERIGSWLFLGEIITTAELAPDGPAIDRCGTCTRCIDACPTDAITAPYQLDASRCISYLTIEHRSALPANLASRIGDWLYGCDICQDVCPWNSKALVTLEPRLQPRFRSGTIDALDVLSWSDEDYRRQLKGSAMKRVKLPVLKRNAQTVIDNLANRKGRCS